MPALGVAGAEPDFTLLGLALALFLALISIALTAGAVSCLLAPMAMVAVDAVEACDRRLFALLVVESLKTFCRGWLGLAAIYTLLSIALRPCAWLLVRLLGNSGELLTPEEATKLATPLLVVVVLLSTAVGLKSVFVIVIAAREASAFEPAGRREPMWVLTLFVLWLAPAAAFAYSESLVSRGSLGSVLGAHAVIAAVQILIIVVSVWVAAGLFNDARGRRSRAEIRDVAELRATRVQPADQHS